MSASTVTTPDAATLEEVLAYAADGWHVFPCWPDGCGKTDADGKPRDKSPRNRNGFLGATTDAKQIRKWWDMWPDSHWGLWCKGSGVAVVDCDTDKEGKADGKPWLEANHGLDVDDVTLRASTPSGGLHLLYRYDDSQGVINSGSQKTAAVDTRTDGYIILPTSNAPGREWLGEHPSDYEPDELPESLLDALRALKLAKAPPVEGHAPEHQSTVSGAEGGVAEGGRNNAAAQVAGKALQDAYGDESKAWQRLRGWNLDNKPPLGEVELRRTFESILDSDKRENPGNYNPESKAAAAGMAVDPRSVGGVDPLKAKRMLPQKVLDGRGPIMTYARAIEESGHRPNINLAVGAALVAYATAVQRTLTTPDGQGLVSLYVLGSMVTSGGKAASEKAVLRSVASNEKLSHLLGDEPKSGKAMHDQFFRKPSHILVWDEFGKVISASLEKNASSDDKWSIKCLLERFSSRIIKPRCSAGDDGSDDSDYKPKAKFEIVNTAALSVYGVTTPSTLFKHVTTESVADGLFGRILVFDGGNRARRRNSSEVTPIGKSVVAFGKHLETARTRLEKGNSLMFVTPIYSPEATAMVDRLNNDIEDRLESLPEDSIEAALIARRVEMVERVATVYGWSLGCGGLGEEPIPAEAVEWAIALVEWCEDRKMSLVGSDMKAGSEVTPFDEKVLAWMNTRGLQTIKTRDISKGGPTGTRGKASEVRMQMDKSPLFTQIGDGEWRITQVVSMSQRVAK